MAGIVATPSRSSREAWSPRRWSALFMPRRRHRARSRRAPAVDGVVDRRDAVEYGEDPAAIGGRPIDQHGLERVQRTPPVLTSLDNGHAFRARPVRGDGGD